MFNNSDIRININFFQSRYEIKLLYLQLVFTYFPITLTESPFFTFGSESISLMNMIFPGANPVPKEFPSSIVKLLLIDLWN